MSDEQNILKRMLADYQEVATTRSSESYYKLSATFDKMNNELRDYAHKISVDEMKAVLLKLKNDVPLTDEDMGKLKSWIVGEAQYYIEKETHFEKWAAELKDTTEKIKELWAEHPDADRLMKLRGHAYDALKTVSNLAYYVKQKESVEKFNAATQEIGETERVVLVSLLEQKIAGSRF